MPADQKSSEGAGPNDAVLARLDGLAGVFNSRFDAVEREQDNHREWMGRMSTALDRVIETLSRQINIETRLAHSEGDQSDFRLDLAAVQSSLVDLKEKSIKGNLMVNGIVGFVSAAAAAFGMKFLGLSS